MAKGWGGFALLTSIVSMGLASHIALADDCPSVRLDAPGGSMEMIPTKDQGDLGICHSYVAATLFDAWAKTRLSEVDRPPHSTSPEYLATLYKLSSKKLIKCPDFDKDGKTLAPVINGGLVCGALDVLNTSGTCSAEEIERYLRNNTPERPTLASIRKEIQKIEAELSLDRENLARFKAKKTNLSTAQRNSILNGFGATIKERETELKELRAKEKHEQTRPYTSDMQAFRKLYSDETLQPHCSREKRTCRPSKPGGIGMESAEEALNDEIVDQVARLTLADLKKEFDQVACLNNRWQFPPLSCKPTCAYNKTSTSTKTQIHGALSSPKALPVEVSFCSAVIRSTTQHRVWNEVEKLPAPKEDSWIGHRKCGWHSALVIGQEKNPVTGKCEYRVRNSWGAECTGQAICSDLRCRCESKTGDILIDRDLLLANTDGISTISEKGACK